MVTHIVIFGLDTPLYIFVKYWHGLLLFTGKPDPKGKKPAEAVNASKGKKADSSTEAVKANAGKQKVKIVEPSKDVKLEEDEETSDDDLMSEDDEDDDSEVQLSILGLVLLYIIFYSLHIVVAGCSI